jgi:hypothetical protein
MKRSRKYFIYKSEAGRYLCSRNKNLKFLDNYKIVGHFMGVPTLEELSKSEFWKVGNVVSLTSGNNVKVLSFEFYTPEPEPDQEIALNNFIKEAKAIDRLLFYTLIFIIFIALIWILPISCQK